MGGSRSAGASPAGGDPLSLEASLSALTNEVANTRGWMRDVADQQREDHDALIRLEGKVDSSSDRMARIESDLTSVRGDLRTGLTGLRAGLIQDMEELVERRLAAEREARAKADQERADKEKEKLSERKWQVYLMILSPFAAALASGLIAWFAARGGSP